MQFSKRVRKPLHTSRVSSTRTCSKIAFFKCVRALRACQVPETEVELTIHHMLCQVCSAKCAYHSMLGMFALYMCAFTCVLSYVCFQCVLSCRCSQRCAPQMCSQCVCFHAGALTCVVSQCVLSHVCFAICVRYSCSLCMFFLCYIHALSNCLGSLARTRFCFVGFGDALCMHWASGGWMCVSRMDSFCVHWN